MSYFHAIYANRDKEIFEAPNHGVVCCSAQFFILPKDEEMIPMPEGSKICTLPEYEPLGWHPDYGATVLLSEGENVLSAVTVFLPPGYTRLLLPGTYYHSSKGVIPYWAYTAVSLRDGQFWVPAVKVGEHSPWDTKTYCDRELSVNINTKIKRLKGNRIVQMLAVCAREFHCLAAKNYFFEHRECQVPCSRHYLYNSTGCIFLQPSNKTNDFTRYHDFISTQDEIMGVCLDHCTHAKDPIISIGHGGENNPFSDTDTLEKIITNIKNSAPGNTTININTNGSSPENIKRACSAGADSVCVTLNSAQETCYTDFFRPQDYTFQDVLDTIKTASEAGIYVSVILLVFPGITDQEAEVEALINLVKDCGVCLIQMRNLYIDPHYYLETVGYPRKPGIGILEMTKILKGAIPAVRFGYFNPSKNEF